MKCAHTCTIYSIWLSSISLLFHLPLWWIHFATDASSDTMSVLSDHLWYSSDALFTCSKHRAANTTTQLTSLALFGLWPYKLCILFTTQFSIIFWYTNKRINTQKGVVFSLELVKPRHWLSVFLHFLFPHRGFHKLDNIQLSVFVAQFHYEALTCL